MGLSSSKQTTNQQQQQQQNVSSSSTPSNPQWVTDSVRNYLDQVNQFAGRDPNSLVAGPSDLQQAGFNMAGTQMGSWKPSADAASSLLWESANYKPKPITGTVIDPVTQASAAGVLDNGIDRYMDPYLGSVVNTTLAGYDDQTGRQRAALEAQAAKAGAFGGSRYGIAQSQFEADTGRNRAATEAGLRSTAFDKATGLASFDAGNRQQANLFNAGSANTAALAQAQMDQQTRLAEAAARDAQANRLLQAAGMFGDLGNSTAANTRADIGLVSDLGAKQREIEQAQALAELVKLQGVGGLLGAAPLNLFTGTNTVGATTGSGTSTATKTDSGSVLGGLLGLASLVPGIGQVGGLFTKAFNPYQAGYEFGPQG